MPSGTGDRDRLYPATVLKSVFGLAKLERFFATIDRVGNRTADLRFSMAPETATLPFMPELTDISTDQVDACIRHLRAKSWRDAKSKVPSRLGLHLINVSSTRAI